MTAEIAILNKSAVALAADSKVTLTRAGKQKTYDTVDKLFSLSKTEPVGAMIFGNAEFVGFPWETILKEYRRRKPMAVFPTVFEWADDLKDFLVTFFKFTDVDETDVAISIALAWIQTILTQATDSATGPDDFPTQLAGAVETYLEELSKAELFLSDEEWAVVADAVNSSIDGYCAAGIMAGFPDSQALLKTVAEQGVRRLYSSPISSGLVVAGFGENELLPSLISFDIDGILAGRLKSIETNRHDVTRRNRGVILPFAQSDMVYRFMEGIDPDYAMLIFESIAGMVVESSIVTARLLGHGDAEIDAIRKPLADATEAAVQTFWEGHERHRRERFASPIIDMAMSLPKDELANLAESLVSLTSLQRRVSRELETVGGAIDVAVISKGDGFVWIKRKHYFNADRNLRFVNSYFHEHSKARNQGGHSDDNNA